MSIHHNQFDMMFGADTALGALLGDEPCGVALDLMAMQMLVRDNTRLAPTTPVELITNGTFDTNTNGWSTVTTAGTLTLSWLAGGMMRLTSNATALNACATQAITTVVGRVYIASFKQVATTGINHRFRVGTTPGGNEIQSTIVPFPGKNTFGFVATTTTTYISIQNNDASSTLDIDDVSVMAGGGNYLGPLASLLSAAPTKYMTDAYGDLKLIPLPACEHDFATLDSSTTTLSSVGVSGGIPVRKTLTTTGAYAYQPGFMVRITDAGNIANWMLGRVFSYSSGTLVLDVYTASGVFTASNWKVIVALGLLAETVRTNHCLQSQAFSVTPWVNTGVTVSSGVTPAPDTAFNADKIVSSAATASMNINTPFTATAVTYSLSVYAKAAGARYIQIFLTNTAGGVGYVNFDLQTGVVGSAGTSWVGSIEKRKDGWYRCIANLSVLLTVGASTFHVAMVPAADSARNAAFTGNGTDGVYLWGAQVMSNAATASIGAYVLSYMPTTTTTVTRITDNMVIPMAAFPQPSVALGTLIWAGYTNSFDSQANTNLAGSHVISLTTSDVSASTTHTIQVGRGDTSSRYSNLQTYIRNEADTAQFSEILTSGSCPVVPPGDTMGVSWDATDRILVSGSVPAGGRTDAFANTAPANFRFFAFGPGTSTAYNRSVVYLPRKMTRTELERRCFLDL